MKPCWKALDVKCSVLLGFLPSKCVFKAEAKAEIIGHYTVGGGCFLRVRPFVDFMDKVFSPPQLLKEAKCSLSSEGRRG